MLKPASRTPDLDALRTLDDKLRFLSSWTIHHANHVRESEDGLKVGGHQASCAALKCQPGDLLEFHQDPGAAGEKEI